MQLLIYFTEGPRKEGPLVLGFTGLVLIFFHGSFYGSMVWICAENNIHNTVLIIVV